MVFCGKPSKSCRQCRKRNIKCDKKLGSCGQCTRANLQCPGYHNPQNLTFRDETTTVLRKVFEGGYPPLLPHVVYSVEDRAKRLFVSHNVFSENAPLNWVKRFYPVNDQCLTFTFKAVSLAYLSNEVHSTSVLQQARKYYSSALALTNKALHSKDIAFKNTTLLTVLLLDFFENLTNDEPNFTSPASKHADGAVALLKLRGPNHFEDSVSLAMFQHLSSKLIPSCLERGIPIPRDFLRLRKEAARFAITDDPEWRLSDVMVQLAALREGLKDSKSSNTSALAAAQYVDLELLDICKALPECNTPDIQPSQSPSSESSSAPPNKRSLRNRNLYLVRELLDETLGKLGPDPV